MARLKTVKLDQPVYEKLLEIGKDVNDGIKRLFYILRDEAQKAGAEKMIEENQKMIERNEEKIKKIPEEKAQFEKEYWEKYNHQKSVLEHQKKVMNTKLEGLKILSPIYAYEEGKEWAALHKKEIELALQTTSFELEALDRKTDQIMDEERQKENYDVVKARLEQQNHRLLQENQRWERIIQACDQLKIDYSEEQSYVG